MSLIDNTTFIYILSKLSGKKESSVLDDLLLSGRNLRTRTLNGDGNRGKKAVFWPNQDLWRSQPFDTKRVKIDFDSLDRDSAANQAFPDPTYKGEYTFNSLAYSTLLNYFSQYCSHSDNDILSAAKNKVYTCLIELRVDPLFCDSIRKKDSLEDLARFIVSSAANAVSLSDKRTQVYIANSTGEEPSIDLFPADAKEELNDSHTVSDNQEESVALEDYKKSHNPPSKKNVLLGFLILAVVVGFAVLMILNRDKGTFVYDPETMWSITLTAPGDMSISDYNSAIHTIRSRLDMLAAGKKYGFETGETSIDLIMPKSLFPQGTPEDVMEAYIACPSQLYLLNEDTFDVVSFESDSFYRIGRDDIEKIILHNERPEGIAVAELEPGTEVSAYIEIVLSTDCATELSKSTAGWKNTVFAQDITANTWYYWNSILSADRNSIYILELGGFSQLLVHNYTQAPLSAAFDVKIKPDIIWEKVESAFYPGEKQCNESQLKGALVQILFKTNLETKASGDWVESELTLKKRLDAVGEPYAFGTVITDGKVFAAVKTSTSCMGSPTIALLTSNSGSLEYICGSRAIDCFNSRTETSILTDSGSVSYRMLTSDDELHLPINLKELATDGTEIKLCVNSLPILSAQVDDSIEEQQISFTNLYFNNHEPLSESNAWVLKLVDEVLGSEEYISLYTYDYEFCPDKSGSIPEGTGFGVHYREDEEKLVNTIKKIIPDAKFRVLVSDPGSFDVILSLNVDETLPQTAAETVEKIYKCADLENSCYNTLTIFLINENNNEKERARMSFYIDSYTKKVNWYYVFENGRLDKYREVFETILAQSEFFMGIDMI